MKLGWDIDKSEPTYRCACGVFTRFELPPRWNGTLRPGCCGRTPEPIPSDIIRELMANRQ